MRLLLGTPSSASVAFTDYSQVDGLGLRYKSEILVRKMARAHQIGEPESE